MHCREKQSLLSTCFLVAAALLISNGRAWSQETPAKAAYEPQEVARDRRNMGSAFVPLDSWVYPVFERFSALGYLDTAILGSKPWTRMECARLTDEIVDGLAEDGSADAGLDALHSRLHDEFKYEMDLLGGGHNRRASLESLYVRLVSINGPALTDSYHFGQTVSYDFGRPFQRGTNGQAGGSIRASVGPIAFFARAE